jgi:hypothetical protein
MAILYPILLACSAIGSFSTGAPKTQSRLARRASLGISRQVGGVVTVHGASSRDAQKPCSMMTVPFCSALTGLW